VVCLGAFCDRLVVEEEAYTYGDVSANNLWYALCVFCDRLLVLVCLDRLGSLLHRQLAFGVEVECAGRGRGDRHWPVHILIRIRTV
jgi:hypothetical protein